VITFLVVAFGQAWSPFAMRVYGEHQSPKTVYGDVLTAWAYLLALGAAAIALFASELLTILTPPEYWPAALSTAICASAAAVHGTTQVTALGISIAKRTRLLVLASGLAAAANVVLNVALIPRFGALGAALSSLAAYALLTGLYLYWTQKLYPIRLDVLKLLVSAAIVIVAPIAGALVDASGSQTVRIAAKAGFLALFLGAGAAVGIWNRGLLRQLTAAA
jgi:O-antigen/teichoic acid export membrane protein